MRGRSRDNESSRNGWLTSQDHGRGTLRSQPARRPRARLGRRSSKAVSNCEHRSPVQVSAESQALQAYRNLFSRVWATGLRRARPSQRSPPQLLLNSLYVLLERPSTATRPTSDGSRRLPSRDEHAPRQRSGRHGWRATTRLVERRRHRAPRQRLWQPLLIRLSTVSGRRAFAAFLHASL